MIYKPSMFKSILRISIIFVFTVAISACASVVSDRPLGDITSAVEDKNLLGIWQSTDTELQQSYLAIMQRDDGYLKLIAFHNTDDRPWEFLGYVTEPYGERYLNLRQFVEEENAYKPEEHYNIVHYFINYKDELELSLFEPEFFKKAINDEMIKGTVHKEKTDFGTFETGIRIEDSMERLIDLLSKNNKQDYLTEPIIFHRYKQ